MSSRISFAVNSTETDIKDRTCEKMRQEKQSLGVVRICVPEAVTRGGRHPVWVAD